MKNKEFFLPVIIGIVATAMAVAVMLFISKAGAAVCVVLGVVLISVFSVYTNRRYRAIGELNNYLSLVCSGNYCLALEENTEGELSILRNNLLKVITTLQTQNEVITNDKVSLADSLADISHQLKTPLTSMLVVSELLGKETDEAKRKEFIAIINAQCERMSWLIQTLLKLSKLDAGTVEMSADTLSVSDIVESSLAPFMITLDLKNIRVEKDVREFTFTGDKNWSVEALQNIIKNCVEHTPDGGSLTVITDETNLFRRIVIKDNGSGIAEEDLPHIFERFYHGKNASADSVGIGLALAKTILNKENASVTVTGAEGEGAAFEIKFYKSVI